MQTATLVDYDPRWPALYARLRAALADALDGAVVAIEHVGGTALPGRRAEPTINVAVAIESFAACGDALIEAIERLGFRYAPEYEGDFAGRRTFVREPAVGTACRVHVYEHAQRAAFVDAVLPELVP